MPERIAQWLVVAAYVAVLLGSVAYGTYADVRTNQRHAEERAELLTLIEQLPDHNPVLTALSDAQDAATTEAEVDLYVALIEAWEEYRGFDMDALHRARELGIDFDVEAVLTALFAALPGADIDVWREALSRRLPADEPRFR